METKLVLELGEVLREQIRLYRQLLSVGQEEHEKLTRNDLTRIPELAQEQEKLIREVQTVDRVRLKMLEKIAGAAKVQPDQFGFNTVLAQLDPKQQGEFRAISIEIRQVQGELDRVNKSNGILIANALNYLKMMSQTPDAVSDGPGKIDKS